MVPAFLRRQNCVVARGHGLEGGREPTTKLNQYPTRKWCAEFIDSAHLGLDRARLHQTLAQVFHEIPRRPPDQMAVRCLELDGETRGWIVDLNGDLQPFAWLETLCSRLGLWGDMPQSVQEKATADRAIQALFQLWKDLKAVCLSLAPVSPKISTGSACRGSRSIHPRYSAKSFRFESRMRLLNSGNSWSAS